MAAERLGKYFFFVFVKIKVLPSSLFAVGRLHKLATFGELPGGIYPWISSSRCMYNLAKKQHRPQKYIYVYRERKIEGEYM